MKTPPTIPKAEQKDMLDSFWTMLQTCQAKVDNSDQNDPVLRLWVEGWYQQWNRVTGESKEPIWTTRAKALGLAREDSPDI